MNRNPERDSRLESTAHKRGREYERAAIVRYLRETGALTEDGKKLVRVLDLSEAIQRGEHHDK